MRYSRAVKHRRRHLRVEALENRQLLAADTLIFADSFEVGTWNGQWVEDSQNDWFRSTQRETDGNYSAEVDGRANDATLTTANPIDLSGYESAELSFSWFIEKSVDSGEYVAVDVYNGSWQEVARLRGNVDQENVWHHVSIPIAGSQLVENFKIRFRADLSGSDEDVNVDNVKLTGVPLSTEPVGLVSHWTADNTSLDAAGDNDGVLVSGASYAEGYLGEAFAFDGIDDRVVVADSPSLRLTDSMTIEGWVRVDSLPTQNHTPIVFRGDDHPGLDPYQLTVTSDGNLLFSVQSLTAAAGVQTAMPLGEFVYVAATLDDATGEMALYLNGVQKAQIVTAVRPFGALDPSANPSVGIGNHGGYPGTPHNFPFHGLIDDLKIHDLPLSAAEILANYDANRKIELSVNDVSVVEGDSRLAFLGNFVSEGSGGLTRPRVLTFGPDANSDGAQELYVASVDTNEILRFDGVTGEFIDVFVSAGAGGLGNAGGLEFSPTDGDLYVASIATSEVLRFDGTSGEYIGTPVSGLSPTGIKFASDGSLYIANRETDEILRYDGTAVTPFVSAGSGGLDAPKHVEIGPDGDLYVISSVSNQILRYDGDTGEFRDVYATLALFSAGWIDFAPSGDLYATGRDTEVCCDTSIVRIDGDGAVVETLALERTGWSFTVGPDGLIYSSGNGFGNHVDRLGMVSAAAFTVTLSAASAVPVTVDFATVSNTATAGADFTPTNGTLTFAPGVSRHTILVPTIDDAMREADETFTVQLSNAAGAPIADGEGVATIIDDDPVTVDPEKPVKVFVLAGQSNMTGTARADNLDPAWNVPQEDVLIWLDHNMDGGQWTTLGPGHGLSTHAPRPDEPEGLDPLNGLGPELSLGRILADAYPDYQIALIKHGDGGRSLASDFNPENIGPPESNAHMWSGLLKKTGDAFAALDAAGPTYEVAGFFWAQGGRDARNWNIDSSDPAEVAAGEEEALERSAQYGENLANFISAVRSEFSDDVPFVISEAAEDVSPELLEIYPGIELVRQGQVEVAETVPGTALFSTAGISLRDAVHFDAMGQVEFGTRFANAYFEILATPNWLPVADDDAYAFVEDSVLSVAAPGVLEGDTDPESSPLTATLVSTAAHGVVALNEDGSFTYTPDTNFHGSDSFTYRANDGTYDSNVATVNITVTAVNDAPVADAQTVAVKENTSKAITLSASDVDGDPLTYAIQSVPTSGTLSGTAPNLIYTPTAGFTGMDSFAFLVSDGMDNSNLATVTINVAENLAPVANSQAIHVDEDRAVAITLTGSDGDGDPITYAVVESSVHGTLTGVAPHLTYTPDAHFHGLDSLTFRVNDGTDDSALATIAITVDPVNDAPVADAQTVSTNEDTAKLITLSGSDIEGDSLSYTVVAGPTYGTLTGMGANRTYTPDSNFYGDDSFTYTVSDGTADSEQVTVSLTVHPVNDAPVAQADTYSVAQDTPLSVASPGVLQNDTDAEGDPLVAVAWTGATSQGGQVTLHTDGSFNYAPLAGFTGIDTFSHTISDGQLESQAVTVSIEVTAASVDAIYVYDIRFESKRGGRDWRAVFEIRRDSNGDGQGSSADDVAAGVAITVEFAGRTYSGTTDSNGVFRTSWLRRPSSGSYAEVVDLALADHSWNPLAIDLEDDSDGDGLPDNVL